MGLEVFCFLFFTPPPYNFDLRATQARKLLLAALTFEFALLRVRVQNKRRHKSHKIEIIRRKRCVTQAWVY
jgi:hypothetical protein